MRSRLHFWCFVFAIILVAGLLAVYRLRTDKANDPPSDHATELAASDPVPESIPAGLTSTTAATPPAAAPAANIQHVPLPLARAIVGSAWAQARLPELSAFANWAHSYAGASEVDRESLVTQGVELAVQRRAVLAQLIRTDPEQALAVAVPLAVRAQLPESVAALLEERVAGQGELSLNGVTPAPGRPVTEPTFRSALIGQREYRAYTYGRRAQLATLPDASINGIAVDNALAVIDSPVRLLEPGEAAAGRPVENVCPISGRVTPVSADTLSDLHEPTAVEMNGRVQVLCSPEHVSLYETQLAAVEHPNQVNEADGSPGSSGISGRPAYSWTHGTKTVLIIRIDFSDLTGAPVNPSDSQTVTEDYAVNRINTPNGVRDFFAQGSFSQTTLQISPTVANNSPDVTDVLRMPQTANFYATNGNNSLLHSDARALAQAAGFPVNSYDRIGVVFSDIGGLPGSLITYAGLANVIGANFWINGSYDFNVVAHELGHTYGLRHANLWQVSDGNPASTAPSAFSVEYGDPFDVMGDGLLLANQFNHLGKSILQWTPDSAVAVITNGGTYRVFRFDDPAAKLTNMLALKIVRDSVRDYWIGYRRATSSASLDGGAYVLWGYNVNQPSDLLDMTTPNSNPNNAGLAIGATFNDTAAGITLQPVAQGGSGADEWLDVQVTFQPRIQWARTTVYADEVGGSAVLTLTRNNNSAGTVTVQYATTNGTAVVGADYTTNSGTITWTNGETTPKTIIVSIANDGTPEGTEAFGVRLFNATGGLIVDNPTATVFITEPGTFDPEFSPRFINSAVERVLALPDGKVIAAGWFTQVQDFNLISYTRRGIAQFLNNGNVDTNFLADGGGITAPSSARVEDIARQPDGKLIIVGNFIDVNGTARNYVARLNADGTLDGSFNPGTGASDIVLATVVQPDGKIIIGGRFASINGTARELVARLNSDGSVDTSFVGPDFGGTPANGWRVEGLALQPDRKLLVGGAFFFATGATRGGMCRLNTNGTVDSTFTGVIEGAHVLGNPGTISPVLRIVPQIDGKILISGQFTAFNNTARSGVARLTSTGALDTFAPTTDGNVNALLVQPDGKILLGGAFVTVNGSSAQHMVRLSSSGTTDTSFAATGPDVNVLDFALQPDGRVLFSDSYGNFQGHTGPLWRFFSGLPALPGTIQWSADLYTGIEGTNVSLTATRVGGSGGAISVNFATVPGTASTSDYATTNGTFSWADGDAASKSVSIPITADGIAEGVESLNVNLGAPLVGGALLGALQQATVNLYTSYGAWQISNFTSSELANPLISGDTADPDNDGIKNAVEYALGLSPKAANPTGLPSSSLQNVTGTNYLALTFRRRVPAFDLIYTPRATNSLAISVWNTNTVPVGAPVNNGDGTETVTYRDSVPAQPPANQRYLRLDVQRIP